MAEPQPSPATKPVKKRVKPAKKAKPGNKTKTLPLWKTNLQARFNALQQQIVNDSNILNQMEREVENQKKVIISKNGAALELNKILAGK